MSTIESLMTSRRPSNFKHKHSTSMPGEVIMCVTDGVLRAKLDGEQTELESREIEEHLSSCVDCYRRCKALALRAERIDAMLSSLAPSSNEYGRDARTALAQFRTRIE